MEAYRIASHRRVVSCRARALAVVQTRAKYKYLNFRLSQRRFCVEWSGAVELAHDSRRTAPSRPGKVWLHAIVVC